MLALIDPMIQFYAKTLNIIPSIHNSGQYIFVELARIFNNRTALRDSNELEWHTPITMKAADMRYVIWHIEGILYDAEHHWDDDYEDEEHRAPCSKELAQQNLNFCSIL